MDAAAEAGRRDTADASCQTDSGATPYAVPLPLHYPANLIYAQSMLTICINQQQRIELNIAMLNFYLREHEERARAAATLAAAKTPMVKLRLTPPVVVFQHGGTTVAAAAATSAPAEAAPPGGGPAAAAAEAGGAAQPAAQPPPAVAAAAVFGLPPVAQLERMQMHRRRIAAAVKIALVMILLEFRAGWFFLYFFMVFLYIGGVFDPIIDWALQRHATQATLEQQLVALRHRQHLLVPPGDRQEQQQQQAQARAQAQAPAPDGPQEQGAASSSAVERQLTSAAPEEIDSRAAPDRSEATRPEVGAQGASASEQPGVPARTGPSPAPGQPRAAAPSGGGGPAGESATAGAAPGGSPAGSEGSTQASASLEAAGPSPAGPAESLAPASAAAAAEEEGDGGPAAPPEQPAAAAAAASESPQQEARPPPPPWAHRFIYQLVVMFFMTLIPWWNPDPRFLRDDA